MVDYVYKTDPYVLDLSTFPYRPDWQFASRTSFHLASLPSGDELGLGLDVDLSLLVFPDSGYSILSISLHSTQGGRRAHVY